ncbi:MAG: phosphate acyltransferase, partial [Gammaproteobacteria bacterium]
MRTQYSVTPLPRILQNLHARASERGARIVLPETADSRVWQARSELEDRRLAEVVWIDDPARNNRFDEVVEHIYLRRKQEGGITRQRAVTLAEDRLYFGASLVALGHADGCVGGSVATTGHVIRAGIHCLGPAAGVETISSFFLMVRDEEVLTFADCAVVPEPSVEQLVDIAISTARNHELMTSTPPQLAFLSYSTMGSAKHPHVTKVRDACALFRERYPDVAADGELQFDAAYIETIGKQKAPDSPVAGRANVFVFPDLDAGNIAYK